MKITRSFLPAMFFALVAGCLGVEVTPTEGTPQSLSSPTPERNERHDTDEDSTPEPLARRPDSARRVHEPEPEDTGAPALTPARPVDSRLRGLQGDYLQAVRMLREPVGHPSREAARAQLKARTFASVR